MALGYSSNDLMSSLYITITRPGESSMNYTFSDLYYHLYERNWFLKSLRLGEPFTKEEVSLVVRSANGDSE